MYNPTPYSLLMRMRNCAHTYLEASLNIATKTENLIKKQEKKTWQVACFTSPGCGAK